MSDDLPTVFVIDDDASVREGLQDLFQSVGLRVTCFGSTAEFLRGRLRNPTDAWCSMSACRDRAASNFSVPWPRRVSIYRSSSSPGHGDIPMSVQAMKSGAVEFLTKPLHDQRLLDAVQAGLERDRRRREETDSLEELRGRYESLTPL